MEDVLFKHRIDPSSLIDVWFEESSLPKTAFIPVFDYLMMLKRRDGVSQKMAAYIAEKEIQFERHFIKLEKRHPSIEDMPSFERRMNDTVYKFSRPELIALAYHKDILNSEQATELLRTQYRMTADRGEKSETDLKMAVTYLGYRRYHDKG